jgi:hypothetical protein
VREHCHSAFARKATLRAHIEKEHVQGDDIDMIAAALGFRPGLPVTPHEMRNILGTPDDDVEEQSISLELGGIREAPVLAQGPVLVPTTLASSKDDFSRVFARPSDDILANLELVQTPRSLGEKFKLEDDVRIIRLREQEIVHG